MDLKETEILGPDISDHWYYISKAKAMMRHIEKKAPNKVLDIGAGSGFFSKYLLDNSSASEAWCIDIAYATEADTSFSGKKIHYRRSLDKSEADLVLLMDVLEHVNDDVALLKSYASKLSTGTGFLISVPAFQILWSGHDEFLDHKRRYTLDELESVVQEAGLHVEHSAYYFGMVFPIAAAIRLAQKAIGKENFRRSQLVRHRPLVNNALLSLCRAELPFMMSNRFFGLTAFCFATKP